MLSAFSRHGSPPGSAPSVAGVARYVIANRSSAKKTLPRRFTNPELVRIVKECYGDGTRDVARGC